MYHQGLKKGEGRGGERGKGKMKILSSGTICYLSTT